MTRFSSNHPWLVIALTILVTIGFASQFPKVAVDTDPKHMLPVTSPVRQFNDRMEKEFALHPDVVALGVVNEGGVINQRTLARIEDLTRKIQTMPGVISRDVVSLTTLDNITAQGGELVVRPATIQKDILENPLFVGRILSADGTTTAIYVPI